MGKVSLSELEAAIQVDPELVRLDQQKNAIAVLTNQTNFRLEQESVVFVNAGIGSAAAINSSFVPFPELVERDGRWLKMQSDGVTHDYTEQRAAVEAMLRSTDQVFALRGVAGAGKTTALKEFHAGVNAAGKSHVLLAPTTKAVEALKREIPEGQVQTVEAFLLASQKGAQLQDVVITVDEWGLLSNRSGHALLRIAKEQGALVRFVGDTRQHVAVEAGDFGRTLEQHSNLLVFGAAFDQKAIYVSHSRARERVDTYVPSKEAFLTRAERAQGERMGVLEAITDAKRKNDGTNGFKVGDRVTWNYEARGGYGYAMPVPGVVTKLAGKRVEIAVPSQSKQARTRVGSITLPDSQWIRVTRWVKPEKLVPRHTRASREEVARLIQS